MPHFKSSEGNLAFKFPIYACVGIAGKHTMETIGQLLLPWVCLQFLRTL